MLSSPGLCAPFLLVFSPLLAWPGPRLSPVTKKLKSWDSSDTPCLFTAASFTSYMASCCSLLSTCEQRRVKLLASAPELGSHITICSNHSVWLLGFRSWKREHCIALHYTLSTKLNSFIVLYCLYWGDLYNVIRSHVKLSSQKDELLAMSEVCLFIWLLCGDSAAVAWPWQPCQHFTNNNNTRWYESLWSEAQFKQRATGDPPKKEPRGL